MRNRFHEIHIPGLSFVRRRREREGVLRNRPPSMRSRRLAELAGAGLSLALLRPFITPGPSSDHAVVASVDRPGFFTDVSQ
jgi:hypothetical protein